MKRVVRRKKKSQRKANEACLSFFFPEPLFDGKKEKRNSVLQREKGKTAIENSRNLRKFKGSRRSVHDPYTFTT